MLETEPKGQGWELARIPKAAAKSKINKFIEEFSLRRLSAFAKPSVRATPASRNAA
jgi:hypothetical protein